MSFNGSGTFLINSTGQPVVANTVISATVFNALTADLASGLTNCITKDGQSTPTANIPMGSNKITGLANGTLINDAATLGQVQTTAAKLIGTIAGVDTITGIMSPTLTAYAAGQLFYFIASGANTGAATLNIDGLGAKAVTRDGSTALAAGDINSGEMVVVIYDGTRFQMINAANSFGNTTINGTLTVTGNTGLQANVSITSTLSVGGTFAVTGAATLGSTLAVTGKSDLPTVSTASINAAVAVVTTGTVTNLTATSASIASANAGAAVVTTATVTNLTSTSASIASANAAVARITTLSATQASASSINAAVALVTTGTVTNLTSTSASIASANLGTAVISSVTLTGASIASVNVGNAVITGASIASMNGAVANITTVNATTVDATNVEVTNVKAKDGTAAIAIADSTGAVTVSTPTVVSVNSSSDALRITQVGAGNALVVEDSANPDATPVIVNADGNLVAGAGTSYLTGLGTRGRLAAVNATADTGQGVQVIKYRATASLGADIELAKSNSSTIGTNTAVTSGNTIGTLWFTAADGTGFIPAATIKSEVDGTPGTNDMPGRLIFSTTADGASTPTERMRIDSAGNIGIGGTAAATTKLDVLGTLPSSSTTSLGLNVRGTIPSSSTNFALSYQSNTSVENASFTLNNWIHFGAYQGTKGASATVTNQFGFRADSSLTGATNNYGFYSNIASGTNRWNFYAAGTAANYFAGNVGIGQTAALAKLHVLNGTSILTSINASADEAVFERNSNCGITFGAPNSNSCHIYFADPDNNAVGRINYIHTTDQMELWTNNLQRMTIDSGGNVIVNTAAIATTATDGFLYVPSCAGTPTGTPTTYTGRVPIVVDTTNHKLYFYSGGTWRDAGP